MASISPGIFREYDIRGLVDDDLTEESVRDVGRALGTAVREQGGRRVVMGRDCRESGPRFARAMTEGLVSTGVDVTDLGVVPTPLTYCA
jgi:phosphomannomutase/phosphoglucomutase